MRLGKSDWNSWEQGISREWLVTNGIGGFASGTVLGPNTRRYHGLLTASFNPPVDRRMLLSKVEEEALVEGVWTPLSTNLYQGGVHPQGHQYLYEVKTKPFPAFRYRLGGAILQREIFMLPGENTTVLLYQLLLGEEKVKLRLSPLINCREYHHLLRQNDWPFRQESSRFGVAIESYAGSPLLVLRVSSGRYQPTGHWHKNMLYRVEEFRGLDAIEDHYNPGQFEVQLLPGQKVALVATAIQPEKSLTQPGTYSPTHKLLFLGAEPLIQGVLYGGRGEEGRPGGTQEPEPVPLSAVEELREAAIHEAQSWVDRSELTDPFLRDLVRAARSFVVWRQSTEGHTIIAGYHWFTDWGRDTMIALPGLTLIPRAYHVAKEILSTFARHEKDGLIPNRFSDAGPADYNTVDASLWFIHALYKYLQYSQDWEGIEGLYTTGERILRGYREGTHYNIHMDEDGLISAGERGTQLTWMDAKVAGWVVTPREGKAVEINALWYNALKIMTILARRLGRSEGDLPQLTEKVRSSFLRTFWLSEKGYLADVIRGEKVDASIRPNQIFAASLPFSPLSQESLVQVVQTVYRRLWTPVGLHSLDPKDQSYKGRYGGNQYDRDSAYHQGTVWGWLAGPLASAWVRAYGESPQVREEVKVLLDPFRSHLRDAGLGNISEIFEGNPPHAPRGCIAQAWSVAEVLRAYVEDGLGQSPPLP